jgi:type II restriction/modification system DNA methylase subunit YeeA
MEQEQIDRINPFDWAKEFPEIFQRGGFSVVIGNPPYVRQEILGEFKSYFQEHYKVYQGTADLYAYFIERGVSLLREGGVFSYIVANKWMRANYGQPLRKWLKEQHIEEIIDFGDLQVFQGATTYPCIIRIIKSTPQTSFGVTQVKTLDFHNLSDYVKENHYSVNQATLDDSGWSLADEKTLSLLNKIKAKGVPLGEYVQGKIYYGIKTGLNEAFVIDKATRARLIAEDAKSAELIKPFLAGRDIKRYEQPKSDKYLIFTRHGVNIDDYAAIKEHLGQFKNRLMPKPKDWNGKEWNGRKPGHYQWYEIQDKIDYYLEFEKPKIVYAEIASRGQFTLEMDNCYYDTTAYIISSNNDLTYLIGLLNSRLWTFLFSKTSSEIRGGFFRWKHQYMSPLPIRTINHSDPADIARHDRMVTLVDQMLTLHKQFADARTPHEQTALQRRIGATDGQIDALVYELYGLTQEEIGIVEGRGQNENKELGA